MKTDLLKRIKSKLPEPIKKIARKVVDGICASPAERQTKWLKKKNYSHLPLLRTTEESIHNVKIAAESIYGNNWNFYSDALRRETVKVFETCIQYLSESHQPINYLEIGSCQGLSMSIIGCLLKKAHRLGKLISIDPYFEGGYIEHKNEVVINKTTKDNAFKLYKILKLEVNHIEEISSIGLKNLVNEKQSFNLIYIDGSHEGMSPLEDLGLSLQLITHNGIIMLDDYRTYPDVKVLKTLCDRHYNKIADSWKVAAYKVCK